MSAQPLEIRMAHLEGAYEQISERLRGIDGRLTALDQKVDTRFDALDRKIEAKADGKSVDARFDAVDRRFNAVDRRFDAVDKKFGGLYRTIWGNTALIIAAVIGAAITLHH